MCFDPAQFSFRNEIGLVEDDLIGESDLLQRFAAVGQTHLDMLGVHHGGDGIQLRLGAQISVDEKCLRHGTGIGETGGFHHDGVEIAGLREKPVQGCG